MACLLTGFMTQNNDFWFPASTKAYYKPSLHLTLLSLASPSGFRHRMASKCLQKNLQNLIGRASKSEHWLENSLRNQILGRGVKSAENMEVP
jgi:hypothetical protein